MSGHNSLEELEGLAGLMLRLRREGISDSSLLTAIEQTPRAIFVPPVHTACAYSSRLIPIECGAFMEGVDILAGLLHALDLKQGQRVLEIGTGSGYSTAIMARMVDRVVSIERYRTLYTLAQQRLEHFGLRNVALKHADGRQGAPGEGTFDRILVSGAFDTLPRNFIDHLASDGVMLTGMTKGNGRTVLTRLVRTGSRFERTDGLDVPYLPLIPGVASRL